MNQWGRQTSEIRQPGGAAWGGRGVAGGWQVGLRVNADKPGSLTSIPPTPKSPVMEETERNLLHTRSSDLRQGRLCEEVTSEGIRGLRQASTAPSQCPLSELFFSCF